MQKKVRENQKGSYEDDKDLEVKRKGEDVLLRLNSNCDEYEQKEETNFEWVGTEGSTFKDSFSHRIVIGAQKKPANKSQSTDGCDAYIKTLSF